MCSVSMIMDHQHDIWKDRYFTIPTVPGFPFQPAPMPPLPTAQEIEEFRRLLDRAREYDRKNNEPDCELEEKRQKLKKMAKELGVDISFV